MGWNTTVVVMNDALDMIRNDPEFGARLADAIQAVGGSCRRVDVAAHSSKGGIHCNAATVIESHHADHTVYVRVGQNYGERVSHDAAQVLLKAEQRAVSPASRL